MKNSLSSLLLAFALISAGGALPAFVAAQSVPAAQEGFDASSPVNMATVENTIDFRWILPLLLVPVLYFVLRSTNTKRDHIDTDSQFAGAKGGRAHRTDFDDDVI